MVLVVLRVEARGLGVHRDYCALVPDTAVHSQILAAQLHGGRPLDTVLSLGRFRDGAHLGNLASQPGDIGLKLLLMRPKHSFSHKAAVYSNVGAAMIIGYLPAGDVYPDRLFALEIYTGLASSALLLPTSTWQLFTSSIIGSTTDTLISFNTPFFRVEPDATPSTYPASDFQRRLSIPRPALSFER